ncbi:hypothetical protein TNCV_1881191 [Trichonephila clavipes]|nr:hypothetical protein TNCV_1881191 [Trichonephila clavipes]
MEEMVQPKRHGRAKSFNGWSKRLLGGHGMPLDFGSLACDSASYQFSDVLQHGRSDEEFLDEALLCDTNTWMGEIVERAKYFKAKLLWHIRPYFFSADITEDFPFLKVLR